MGNNPETLRLYYQNNKDTIKARSAKWARDNPIRANEKSRQWSKDNPKKRRDIILKNRYCKIREGQYDKLLEE